MMFLQKAALISLVISPFFAQGSQLRGSRNLQDDNCSPELLDTPVQSSAYVVVAIEGEGSSNITDIQLQDLASTFDLSYNTLVSCVALPGSIRDLQQATPLAGAEGPISSYLLRLDFFCNACGEGVVEVFKKESLSIIAPAECPCEGPQSTHFLDFYGTLFEAASLFQVANVAQVEILDCPTQNTTTFNSTSVCLGPDRDVRQVALLPSGKCNEWKLIWPIIVFVGLRCFDILKSFI
jgi:hypothetical protein